ncbi:MAG TPA: hypothetical protein VJA21_09705 [Verrucomicrobiae bacterium]
MKQSRQVTLVALGAAVFLAACSAAQTSREPVYQGKPLSVWLKLMGSKESELHKGAIDAIRQTGSNGLPMMVEILQSQDPTARRGAFRGLHLLGSQATPAVPVLGALLQHPDTADEALSALLYIGPPAVPVLCAALTNQSPAVRALGANGLNQLHWTSPPWVGAQNRAQGSGLVDPKVDEQVIVPLLLQRTLDPDKKVREFSKAALASTSARTPSVAPTILSAWTNYLGHGDAEVRAHAAESVFCTLPQVESIVPALIKLLDDPTGDVREKAAAAFRSVSRISVWTNRYPDLEARLYAIEWGPSLAERPKDPPNDSEIKQRLPGTWVWRRRRAGGDLEEGSLTISPDGAFQSHWTVSPVGREATPYTFEGTWWVKDGYWITRSMGDVNHDRILRVDNEQFVSQCAGIESNGILVRPTASDPIKRTRAK